MLREFKAFAMRGNVLDIAVGVVIGAAFGKIVTSLVNDILMPPIGLLLGKVDFTGLYLNLSGTSYPSLAAAKEANAATINYGVFLNNVLDFIIIAFVLFMIIRQVNRLTAKPAAPVSPTTKECPFCLSQVAIKATRCPHCTSQLDVPES